MTAVVAPREVSEAGFVTRAIALGIDGAIIAASISLTTLALSSISSLVHLSLEPRRDAWAAIAVSIGGTVFVILYNVVCWTLTGRTPGKAIMGLRVESASGGRVTIGKAFLRLGGYLLSTLLLGAGFAWVLVDDKRRGWHDHLAGTRVVHVKDVRTSSRIDDLLKRTSRMVTISETHMESVAVPDEIDGTRDAR